MIKDFLDTVDGPLPSPANKKKLFEHEHAKLLKVLKDITAKKNGDYTGQDEDPYKNFLEIEKLGITSAEIGMLTRMTDKWMRIVGLIKNGEESRKIKSESLKDTCLDLANYLLLLIMVVEEKQWRDTTSKD